MKRNYPQHIFLLAVIIILALGVITSNGIPGMNATWNVGDTAMEQENRRETDKWFNELNELMEHGLVPNKINADVFAAPELRNFSSFKLDSAAAALTHMSDDEFNNKYTEENLYASGILRSNSLSPYRLSRAEGQDPVFYYPGLIYTSDFANPVLSNLGIGSTFHEVTLQLGDPQFQNEEHCYIGYKTEDYYIAFRSTVNRDIKTTDFSDIPVDRIYLEKRYPLPENLKNVLLLEEDFFLSPRFHETDPDNAAEHFVYYDTQFYRGGWNRGYLFGMGVDTYSMEFTLWTDFEGELPIFDHFGKYTMDIPPDRASSWLKTRQITHIYDMDFPEWRIFSQCQWESYLANMFAAEGVAAADGSKAAVALKNTLYERSRVWIRSLTGDFPDRCFSGGHFVEKLSWLDNRYLLCQVYQEKQPFLYDFESDTGSYLNINELLPDPEYEDGDSFELISADKEEQQILLSHCSALNKETRQLTLYYDFDELGTIYFSEPLN